MEEHSPLQFTIILPTYNRARILEEALASVQALRLPEGCEAEILVVDNNSTDDTAAVCEAFARKGPLPLRYVLEVQQGASHARNRALAEAQYEHLVFLDDDMKVGPGWLEGYQEAWRKFGAECLVGPVFPWWEVPPPDWMTQQMLDSLTSAYSRKGDTAYILPDERGEEIPGCNFGVLKSAAINAGGFETRIDRRGESMLGGGDWDLGRQIVARGGRVVYTPDCTIEHFISCAKMSREGMRRRWRDMGRTLQAWETIGEKRLSFRTKAKMARRLASCCVRSVYAKAAGNDSQSFQYELYALLLRGHLLDRNVLHG